MIKKPLAMLLSLLLPALCGVAAARPMTLDEAIALARVNSVDAAMALNELRASYWQYRSYRADLLPELSFNATTPSYSKRYSSYQNPDGSYNFVRSGNLELSGSLTMKQNVWLTGGSVGGADLLRLAAPARPRSLLALHVGAGGRYYQPAALRGQHR